ncbi:aldo/keto reductase [Pseudolysinimonas kribbensis]|uniref:Oxidoreductase n=1 Tax=Pseudolysinimonas kribbensis TaxID=433641 RepID=A0ABQ6K5T5_9MICO|nr:aldo/keto reductase [Pseudolysinimonas kribbensis]GMA94955.1 oxidoreductase [Pseudolysinimonas kribbensis]
MNEPDQGVDLGLGVRLPRMGLGVGGLEPERTGAVVALAVSMGYRHVDTAQMYGNEEEVRRGVEDSGVDPSSVFITSKVTTGRHRYDDVLRGFDVSDSRLGAGRIDLYLIHWPLPGVADYVETWRALCRLRDDGRVRAVGVSNFGIPQLEVLAASGLPTPAVNQVELHPYFVQTELTEYHARHGIVTEAWAPLAQGRVFDDPVLEDLASERGRTVSQIVLRWHLQAGRVVFPKSTNHVRLAQNLRLADFSLSEDEMRQVVRPQHDGRLGPRPEDVVEEMPDPRGDSVLDDRLR